MKKTIYVFALLILAAFLFSCISISNDKPPKTKDFGVYNPENVTAEDLCTIIIDQYVLVYKFDDDSMVGWIDKFTEKTIKIPSGVHTFHAWYADRQRASIGFTPVIAQLEKGNTYILKGIIANQRVNYHVFLYNDRQEGTNVTLNINRLQGNDGSLLSNYIRYVLNPTTVDVGNSVKLENDNYILLFETGMLYTLTDKKTGRMNKGRCGFEMDFSMTNGKVFLLETDIGQISAEQFLESQYKENAQIILIPVSCNENEVTYRYEKPAELQGNEITFTTTEIKRE